MEEDIIKRAQCNFHKLDAYGFQKQDSKYVYHTTMMDQFRVEISIDQQGNLSGKLYDQESGEEYVNHRIKQQTGEFVSHVREAYFTLLHDIVRACFDKQPFLYEQANRIATYLKETYGTTPEFMWEKYPGHGVFRNKKNQKWYGIIMNIHASKIVKEDKDIEILDVKIEPEELDDLLKREGFFPAYHMNKKSWITILLDDTVKDQEIKQMLDHSYQLTLHKK